MEAREIAVHGHRFAYRTAGSGPVVLLVHGMARSSETWREIVPWLADGYRVIAPDLLGHGLSAKPTTDYSVGAHACCLRDLLVALGHDSERVAVVGHSFGGGVAMQFAYQFPERCDRMVLVASGGLGRDVHPILRALAVPGAEWVVELAAAAGIRSSVESVASALARLGLRASAEIEEVWDAFVSLADADCRRALLHTIRSVIDARGQRVSAVDRLYLAATLPTLIVWGARDVIIPVAHAHEAHAAIPGSRLEIFEDAGHVPHRSEPRRFVEVLRSFLEGPRPEPLGEAGWSALLQAGPAAGAAGSSIPR
ncbi:MAG TPA: alpha/beta fold hydrolase [Candidatus Binatia bacterium]|nr:alpha/beta fold hydrolase [Candidatus Binatia bacterium]